MTMSTIEEVTSDLERHRTSAVEMKDLPVDVRTYFRETVWPTLQAMAEVLAEQDESIDGLIGETDDILHTETAQEITKPIVIALSIAQELEKRLPSGKEHKLRDLIAELRASAAQAISTIQDITVPDDEDEDEEAPAPAATAPAAPAATDESGDDDDDDDDDEEDDDDDE